MATPFDPTLLEPTLLWAYFDELSRIPRGSGNEAPVRGYLLAEAARLGLEAEVDEVGNVLMRKPASPGREGAVVTALQGHLDMVCEKNSGTVHDFEHDPLRLVCEGDWVRAEGTTLGADNGIGVAAALAVLASENLSHGPLECLFTVDEERGLTGAVDCRPGWLRSRYLLNLDGEDIRQLCISCAGGLETQARRHLAHVPTPSGRTSFRLQVSGLQGGHSGVDIHLGRGNAIHILARALDALMEVPGTALAELGGGSRRNVIPREASALLVAPPDQAGALQTAVARILESVREGLGAFDPAVEIHLGPWGDRPTQVLAPEEGRRIVDLLRVLPHGVRAMSAEIPGLVQTSTNLAVLEMSGDGVEITLSHRSSVESAKAEAGRVAALLAERFGFEVEEGGAYPGWKPEPHSELVALAQKTHAELTGGSMELRAIHAGLECGILGAKHPGLQMVSFGPDIVDAHSPQERVSIASVARFWEFLGALLKRV